MNLLGKILLLLSFFSSISVAQNSLWQQTNGPSGEAETTIFGANKSGYLFGSFYYRLFRSIDKGKHWEKFAPLFDSCSLVDFAINKQGELFIVVTPRGNGAPPSGLYHSVDNGDTWSRLLDVASIPRTLAVSDSTILISGLAPGHYDLCNFSSFDHGKTWQKSPEAYGFTYSCSVDPKNIFYLSKHNNSPRMDVFLHSTDNGHTWDTLPPLMFGEPKQSLTFTPWGKIFGVFNRRSGGSQICTSTDNGHSWDTISQEENLYFYSPEQFYLLQNGTLLLLATNGIAQSKDSGKTWTPFFDQIQQWHNSIAQDPDQNIFVSSFEGVYLLDTVTPRWIQRSPVTAKIGTLTCNKNGDLISSVHYLDDRFTYEGYLTVSRDDGTIWEPLTTINQGPRNGFYYTIATDSGSGVYAFNTDYDMSYQSSDDGKSWTDGYGSFYTTTPLGRTYALWNNGRVAFTDNQGSTWSSYKVHQVPSGTFFSFCSNTNGYLLAGSKDNIWRMKVGDTNWTYCGIGTLGTKVGSLCSTFSGDVYAGSLFQGVYHSSDNGVTWEHIVDSLTCLNVNGLACDRAGTVYVATSNGVFRYHTDSKIWEDISEGLGTRDVSSVCVTRQGKLFAGTNGMGVYKFNTLVASAPTPSLRHDNVWLQVYPNPATGKFTISYTLSEFSTATVEMIDELGRTVLHQDINSRPSYSLEINNSQLSPGVYIVKLTSQHGTASEKIIVNH
jgi:photosystem II stability/assembly factor-like uncharacterized protein